MKAGLYAPIVAIALLATAGVSAQSIQIDIPANIEPAKSTVSRAEVVADLCMWRLSGLQALTEGDRTVDTESDEYRRDYATYTYLRSSPQFAALVRRLKETPNASVIAKRTYDVAQTVK